MKYYITLLIVNLFVCCSSDEPTPDSLNLSLVDINSLTAVSTETPFEVMLQNTDGTPVMPDELISATNYQIVFESEVLMNYYIRITDGFEITHGNAASFPDTRKAIAITTSNEIPGQLFLGIIPLIVKDKVYYREPPKGILLP